MKFCGMTESTSNDFDAAIARAEREARDCAAT
jgi:hypothetical protein